MSKKKKSKYQINTNAGNVPVAVAFWNKLFGDNTACDTVYAPDGSNICESNGSDVGMTGSMLKEDFYTIYKLNIVAHLLNSDADNINTVQSELSDKGMSKVVCEYPGYGLTLYDTDGTLTVHEVKDDVTNIYTVKDVDTKHINLQESAKTDKQVQQTSITSMLIELAKQELDLSQNYLALKTELELQGNTEGAERIQDLCSSCMLNSGKLQGMMQDFSEEAENIESGIQQTLEED